MPGATRLRAQQLTRRAALQGLAVSALSGLFAPAARAGDLKVGAPAPEAMLATLDGRRIATPQLLGKVVILTFWATWCEPCHEELPLLSAYAARHADAGLEVLGFTLDGADKLSEVESLARTLSFPVGLLERSSADGYGRIWRLPVSFAIDRTGRLAMDGWKEKKPAWTAERLEQVVSPLLATAK